MVRSSKSTFYYSPDPKAFLPVIVLLHGAGDHPENMLEAWKELATKQRITLLAPELPRDPTFEDAAPAVFRCIVDEAGDFIHIDPWRVYLFGNSMGGYLAFDGAMFQSQYFAAIAVHANRIDEDYAGIVKHATRKIPIAIYIGDRDQYFSVESVRKTRDLLLKEGFPVHYVELDHHDHNTTRGRTKLTLTPGDSCKNRACPPRSNMMRRELLAPYAVLSSRA